MIIRIKIPLFFLFFMFGCSSGADKKDRLIKTHQDQIASKLRLSKIEERNSQIRNEKTLFSNKTSLFFKKTPEAQKINIVDINNDGHFDLILLGEKYSSPRFFIWQSNLKKFVLKEQLLFPKGFHASYLYFDDFNGDQILDVFAGQFYLGVQYNVPPSEVFFGKINRQTDKLTFDSPIKVLEKAGPHSSSVIFDFDKNGKLDFLQTFWIKKNVDLSKAGQSFFFPDFFRLDGARGEIRSEKIKPSPSWSGEICDIDNDGELEVLIGNTSGHRNFVLENDKQRGLIFNESKYKTIYGDQHGDRLLLGHGNTFGFLCADLNNDGLLDLISFEEKKELQDATRDPIRIHWQGKVTDRHYPFLEEIFPIEMKNYSIKNVIDVDIDNDGDLDLLLENSGHPPYSRLLLFENDGGKFKNISNHSGVNFSNPSGVITADLNEDGHLDVLSGQSKVRGLKLSGEIKIFLNKGNNNNSVFFKVDGRPANRKAIGAFIKVKSANTSLLKLIKPPRGGIPSQSDELVHFGLGQDSNFSVAIKWPEENSFSKEVSGSVISRRAKNVFTICRDGRLLDGKKDCR